MSYEVHPKVMPSVEDTSLDMPIDFVTEIIVRSEHGEWSFDPATISSLNVLYNPIK